jgi:hypothetical protein
MNRISTLLMGAGLVALQGCAAVDTEEDITSTSSAVTPSGSATLTITSDWGSGYCANVDLTNALTVATTRWQVIIDFKGLAVPAAPWNTTFESHGNMVTAHPASYNTSIAPNGTASFGFCGSSVAGGVRPAIKVYNMEANYFTTCQSNNGTNPAKAALAVAMATELGRWEPDLDLTITNGRVVLASTAVCVANSCKNTKAMLGQQDYTPDQNIFNNTNFCEDLKASFQRQRDLITNLTNNNKPALPISNYKLTLVGGPTSLGFGNCGPHYIYKVDYKTTGLPLSSTDAANLINTMCFYGAADCGNNPYIGYVSTNVPGCPSGKTCIAIDPTDGDNGSTSTTTAGSAPTYPANRVYNPTNSLLGTQCITTAGLLGTMTSRCASYPSTCGTLYCIAN